MDKQFNPSIIRIVLIVVFAALLISMSTQARQALAAEYPDLLLSSSANTGTNGKDAVQYRDIQLVGQVIALLAGMCFLLLAVAPFILLRDQDQRSESDKCHFSNKPE